jgi:hypothetical protein
MQYDYIYGRVRTYVHFGVIGQVTKQDKHIVLLFSVYFPRDTYKNYNVELWLQELPGFDHLDARVVGEVQSLFGPVY